MQAEFQPGDRVIVRRDPEHGPGPWPAEPSGVVAPHPASPDGRTWIPVATVRGCARTYWVVFDEPQLDAEGDGPYFAAEVLEKHVEPSATS